MSEIPHLTVIAPVHNGKTGVGKHAVYLCTELLKRSTISIIPLDYLSSRRQDMERYPENLRKYVIFTDTFDNQQIYLWLITIHYLNTLVQIPRRSICYMIYEMTHYHTGAREALAEFEWIWSPTEWGRQILVDNGLNPEKIAVIPEGVDGRKFYPISSIRQKSDPFNFFFIARFGGRKSFSELFSAFEGAFSGNKNIKLYCLCGSFSSMDQIMEKLSLLGIESIPSQVEFLSGSPSDEELNQIYSEMHCMVMPTKAEGWGLPMLEAMASGLPLITSNYSAHTEFVKPEYARLIPVRAFEKATCPIALYKDQEYGLWAKIEVEDIKEALLDVYHHYGFWAEQANSASEYARKYWSWHASGEKINQFFQEYASYAK